MRKLLGLGALVMGGVGVLLCAAVIGIAWWAAIKSADRLEQIAVRVDRGLSQIDAPLARIELRLHDLRADFDEVRDAAEQIADENPELPRVRAEIDRLLDRLVPTLERAESLAESLGATAAAIRTAADIVDQFAEDSAATVGVRNASERIDGAAEALNALRLRIEQSKTAKAVHLSRELVALAREAIAGSELLAEGLSAAREEIDKLRQRTFDCRDRITRWIYTSATITTLGMSWVGSGQLCLLSWGRRRLSAGIS